MARKYRLEIPNGCYHVINRGNYRFDVYRDEATKAAFEAALFEACLEWSWLLHGYVIMRNHFHLAIRTPQANLVRGMHWLESTFANRFNRLRKERGHLFQGRYQALVIGGDHWLGEVCDYIHLNPARARIVPVDGLGGYRYSTYWYLWSPQARPGFMQICARAGAAGVVADTAAGWRQYHEHLEVDLKSGVKHRRRYVHLTRGWAIGSDAFKAQLISMFKPQPAVARAWTLDGSKFIRAVQWDQELSRALTALGKTQADALRAKRSEPWKLAIASWLRETCKARNNWLSERLGLGAPAAVSRNLARYRLCMQQGDPTWSKLMSMISA